MELIDFIKEEKKIGIQTVNLLTDERLKIHIVNGEEILNFKADKNYTAQITVTLVITPNP